MAQVLSETIINKINLDFAQDTRPERIVLDELVPGLGYRLRKSGHRSWIVQYQRLGVFRRITVGNAKILSLDEARDLGRKYIAELIRGNDPRPKSIADPSVQIIEQQRRKIENLRKRKVITRASEAAKKWKAAYDAVRELGIKI